MKKPGEWDGSLGIRLSGDLYIDLSETDSEYDLTALIQLLSRSWFQHQQKICYYCSWKFIYFTLDNNSISYLFHISLLIWLEQLSLNQMVSYSLIENRQNLEFRTFKFQVLIKLLFFKVILERSKKKKKREREKQLHWLHSFWTIGIQLSRGTYYLLKFLISKS